MTDVVELGRAFRQAYLLGLKRLLRQGKLKIGGRVAFLNDAAKRKAWLDQLEQIDWNVFSQGPPHGKSDPLDVVKYLASYLTGGPIANRRIIKADEEEVWFWARPKKSLNRKRSKRRGMNASRPYRLSARQFMQRWTLHILPKGFIRSRCYGGYHGTKRASYLDQCRELLSPITQQPEPPTTDPHTLLEEEASERKCSHCASELRFVSYQERPSWRQIFERDIYHMKGYSPQFHLGTGRPPPRQRVVD